MIERHQAHFVGKILEAIATNGGEIDSLTAAVDAIVSEIMKYTILQNGHLRFNNTGSNCLQCGQERALDNNGVCIDCLFGG